MVEIANVSPSPQNANVFVQTSQKGNQQPGGKKKKGKKGEGNQNKPKPTTNADGDKKEKKVKFPCKLCQEDHLTHQCPLLDQAQKLLKSQQPVVLKDPFPKDRIPLQLQM